MSHLRFGPCLHSMAFLTVPNDRSGQTMIRPDSAQRASRALRENGFGFILAAVPVAADGAGGPLTSPVEGHCAEGSGAIAGSASLEDAR